jgi:hypothetical protein
VSGGVRAQFGHTDSDRSRPVPPGPETCWGPPAASLRATRKRGLRNSLPKYLSITTIVTGARPAGASTMAASDGHSQARTLGKRTLSLSRTPSRLTPGTLMNIRMPSLPVPLGMRPGGGVPIAVAVRDTGRLVWREAPRRSSRVRASSVTAPERGRDRQHDASNRDQVQC